MKRKIALLGVLVGVLLAGNLFAGPETRPQARLCVIWSSGDPEVATNVCFMYTLNAKKQGWFEVVHLVVWGPSAKLLVQNKGLQDQVKAMQQAGVVTEACVTCANNYGVADELKKLSLDVKKMGPVLTERLKDNWKVLTF